MLGVGWGRRNRGCSLICTLIINIPPNETSTSLMPLYSRRQTFSELQSRIKATFDKKFASWPGIKWPYFSVFLKDFYGEGRFPKMLWLPTEDRSNSDFCTMIQSLGGYRGQVAAITLTSGLLPAAEGHSCHSS